jgi:hypothetical protein
VICLLLSLVAALWFPWALILPAGYAIGLTLGTLLTRGNAGTIPGDTSDYYSLIWMHQLSIDKAVKIDYVV